MNPCIEFCHIRHGKEYSKECDDYCDYAKAVKNYKGVIDRVLEIIDEIHENILRRDCIVAPQAQSVFIALRRRLGEMKGGEQE